MSPDRVLRRAFDLELRMRVLTPRGNLGCRPKLCQGAPVNRKSVVRCYAEDKGPAGSAREKLRANPAYQRLKNASWKDSYKPADAERPPGPVPKHLLSEDEASLPAKQRGSITEQWPKHDSEPSTVSPEEGQETPNHEGQLRKSRSGLASSGSSPPQRQGRVTRVRFWVQYRANFGQRMRIVGSHANLGGWVLGQGVELQWSPEDRWSAIVELPAGAIVEYKYVLCEAGARAIAWQQGNNSVLAVGHGDDEVEVEDTWEASPGCSVTAGGLATTREGRLLSWANEIESLFASQRSDLRKSRMELVAAQEDARIAREEARRFRLELRASEAERVKAEMKVKELTSANRVLRTQLTETTMSFRNALETTHQFLLEAEQAMLAQRSPDASPPDLSPGASGASSVSEQHDEESSSSPAQQDAAVTTNASATSSMNGAESSEAASLGASSDEEDDDSGGSPPAAAAPKKRSRARKATAQKSSTTKPRRTRRGTTKTTGEEKQQDIPSSNGVTRIEQPSTSSLNGTAASEWEGPMPQQASFQLKTAQHA